QMQPPPKEYMELPLCFYMAIKGVPRGTMGCLEKSANATTSLVCAVTSFENVPETETLSFVPATGGSGEIDTWSKAGALDAPVVPLPLKLNDYKYWFL
ncbi:11316_t:CDS:2, partial [Funneliformis caledonium]